MFVWFALDNIDFLESTPCGMNTLHGTAIAIYQSAAPDKTPMTSPIEIDRSTKAQTLEDTILYKSLTCKKPEPMNQKRECKLSTENPMRDLNKKTDMAWLIGCLNFNREEQIEVKPNAVGTWGAFNSLLTSSNDKTN